VPRGKAPTGQDLSFVIEENLRPEDQKTFAKFRQQLAEYPNFVENQLNSYQKLVEEDMKALFNEFSPISDYSGKKFDLEFKSLSLGKPKYDEHYAKANKLTYQAQLRAKVKLTNKSLGTSKDQEIFLTELPLMTDHGTFVINGVERVIVPQLIRSFGILFTEGESRGKRVFGAKVIPARGVWIELEVDYAGVLQLRLDRKRKIPATVLLKALEAETPEKILKLFQGDEAATTLIKTTLQKDKVFTTEEAAVELYRRLREGDIVSGPNAKEFIDSLFTPERYDLSRVGRYRFNQRFDLGIKDKDLDDQVLSLSDLVLIIKHIAALNNDPQSKADDIDHLGSRRVRYVGEQFEQKLRVGLSRMKRNVQDRMSTIEIDTLMPIKIINPRVLQAIVREFFASNQLSQFMLQDNVLSEISHLRTLSAMGPGGLTRERAGFEVRDVHPSHYGRLCPIHTPEGPNIGLVLRLATFSRINEFGMIEAPYAVVEKGKITGEVKYLNAYEEEGYIIAHAAAEIDNKDKLVSEIVEARQYGKPIFARRNDVQMIDVATNQALSIATSMIPFVNHNDANRALMGSNMQKQAMPCLRPEAPLVATGIEAQAALDSGRILTAYNPGTVSYADGQKIEIETKDGKKDSYNLLQYEETNGHTALHQRPVVSVGDKVKRGAILADTTSTDRGQISIGQNARVAFMTWNGNNYEDAIVISERLVKDNKFQSIHLEEVVVNVRDTKLGPEQTTPDIPNVSEQKLRNLDEEGVVRVGAEVGAGDILVGKITPKGETQLTPEERLLRSIFGEKARDVKDTSRRMPVGKKGRVVSVHVFTRENGDQLDSGIIKRIHVQIAQLRPVQVGDKLAGRHGNKGVISTILPEEDMPFDQYGNPVDILLTPLGVPSRMNLGQIMELHLGLAAAALGYQAIVPPFAGATEDEIKDELEQAGYDRSGKMTLYDGQTGEPFQQSIAVGYMYMLKLHHMVEDKIHQRAIGPYSLITQQPLGGKSQNGGQRFGEMEVWALLGYGAAHTLREMLTYKSDDILGRSAAFDSIVKGKPIQHTNVPASFNVLLNNLRALSLDVQLISGDQEFAEVAARKADTSDDESDDDEADSDDLLDSDEQK
jgi:DNA-directed RNA polymerase subunit beta